MSPGLGPLDSISVPGLGTRLNTRITNERHHLVKKKKKKNGMALNRPRKGHLLLVWELKQEGRVSPHLTSAGNSKVFTTPHASANERAMRTDLGVTDQVHGVGKFAETESTDNGDRLQLKEEKCLAPKQRGSHKGLAALAGPAVIFPTPLCSRQQR